MAYNPKTGKGLGRFYSAEHRAFRAREWRGFRDTFYDFFRWLYLYGFMAAKLGCHPILMVKAMLRYRWMVSYLTAAHMVDRHTMGLRGKELRYAHNQFFSVLHNSVLGVRDIIIRDKNLRPNSKHAAKLRENTVMFDEMTPHLIMMGFPTVKWIDIAMFAIGLPSEVDQNASMFYIDAMEHLGLPADVCPEPAAESGCAVVDDYPRVGKCYFTGTMPCDGAISQTNILTRHFKELPSFQITPPQRVNEPEVQTYAVKNLKKGIEFLEQQFGVKWDWDAFWKNAEMYNESSRCMIEKWDVNCTEHPQVCGAALALQREYEFHGGSLHGQVHAQDGPPRHEDDAQGLRAGQGGQRAPAEIPLPRLGMPRALLHQLYLLDAALLGCHLRQRHGGHAQLPAHHHRRQGAGAGRSRALL